MALIILGRTPKIAGVVSVRHDVAVVGAAIHALRIGVGEAEAGACGNPPLPLDLQAIVLGIYYTFLFLNLSEALVRTERVDVHPGVREQRAHGGLINVIYGPAVI